VARLTIQTPPTPLRRYNTRFLETSSALHPQHPMPGMIQRRLRGVNIQTSGSAISRSGDIAMQSILGVVADSESSM